MHSTVSAYRPDRLCHAQCSNYIAATHNITHSLCTLKCATHPPLLTPLPSTTLLCIQLINTKHICVSGSKMVEDVGIVCKCCGVISILVWLVLRVPYPHALVFLKENFFVSSSITIHPPAGKQRPTFHNEHTSIDHDFGKYHQALQNLKYWKHLKGRL